MAMNKFSKVTMVRIYFTEGEKKLEPLMYYLHDQARVKGVTVFRGISGFGKSGTYHTSGLVEMSYDLPLVIEFFDKPDRVDDILKTLDPYIEAGHLVMWPAYANEGKD